jgi:anti-sigma factor RsiW
MLTEQYRELLTAYVDGEISGRQRRALHKLLRRSPEARKLLKEMQADSDEIRALPPARLDQDLSDSVLTLIAQRQIQIPRPRVTPPPVPVVAGPSRSFWPYVVAAMVMLLAVLGASFLFFYLFFRFLP